MKRRVGLVLLAAVALGGCGGGEGDAVTPDEPTSSAAAGGTCLEGATECADIPGQATPGPPQGIDADETPDEAAIVADARSLIGRSEDAVLQESADVRLGRHGDDQFALTEDYVVGRKTIATEDDGTGTYRVVEVTVELTDGPLTITEGG